MVPQKADSFCECLGTHYVIITTSPNDLYVVSSLLCTLSIFSTCLTSILVPYLSCLLRTCSFSLCFFDFHACV